MAGNVGTSGAVGGTQRLSAAAYARSVAPAGFRWEFVFFNGERVTFNGEPVVELVRV